jgi:hypothetical protein
MDGIAIVGCKPRPDVAARIAADRERIGRRARRYTPPIETRAAVLPGCPGCGFGGWMSGECSSCGYTDTPRQNDHHGRVEHRATSAPSQRTTTRPVRVEHSQHIGRIIDVR